MSAETRAIPGTNREGFVPLDAVRARARELAPSEFVAIYFAPVLHVQALPGAAHREGTGTDDAERSFRRTQLADDEPDAAPGAGPIPDSGRYHDRLGFLLKRPGNPFPQMISLGRAMNNDLVVVLETISKMHGYFLLEGSDRWCYTDHRSTNGSAVNGDRLKTGEKRPLRDGDLIRLGFEVQATFRSPGSLHTLLTGMA
jgi:hypothetical protein